MPVLGTTMPGLSSHEIERDLLNKKSGYHRNLNRNIMEGGRGRRGRRYRSRSFDGARSSSAPRVRSGSVASTMSVSSRRGGGRGDGSYHNQNLPSLKNLRKQLRNRYPDKTMAVVNRYVEEMEANAEIANNINYLRRCKDLGIIPKEYWMINNSIRNTREVVRMLDELSYRLMCHDEQYHILRRTQLTRQLSRTEEQLVKLLTDGDLVRLVAVVRGHRSDLFSRIRDEQRKSVDSLRKEVADYQSYLREKRKPRRNAESAPTNRRRSRNRNKDEVEGAQKAQTEKKISEHHKEQKDSDGEDRSAHRVQRRTAGSTSSREEDSASD